MTNIKTCEDCDSINIKAKGKCQKHYQKLKSTYSNRKCSCGEPLPKYAHKYCHLCANDNKKEVAKRAKAKYRTKLEWLPNSVRNSIEENERCLICLREIDYRLKWPNLMSPSIEHITPLSMGGTNIEENLAYTHLVCNVKRKNNKNLIHGDLVRITNRTVANMTRDNIESLPIVLPGLRLAVTFEHIIEDYIRLRKMEEELNG